MLKLLKIFLKNIFQFFFVFIIITGIGGCKTFVEHYSVNEKIEPNKDRVLVFASGDLDKKFIEIFKIDLNKRGIITVDIPYKSINEIIQNKIMKDINRTTMLLNQIQNLNPPLILTTKNIEEKINNDVTKDDELIYIENQNKKLKEYELLIKNFLKDNNIKKIILIYKYTPVNIFDTNRGIQVKLFTYEEIDENRWQFKEDFNYILIGLFNDVYKEMFYIQFDRDIKDVQLYENDLFVPYNNSIKRYFEISRRITDLIIK